MSATVRRFTAEADTLDFSEPDPESESESYQRAHEHPVIIHPKGRFLYLVTISDKEPEERTSHLVEYHGTEESLRGRCDCDGWTFHDGPCAHLWALNRADGHGSIDRHDVTDVLEDGARCPACGERPSHVEDEETEVNHGPTF